MAHLIETMTYSGDVPWHGLGTKINPDLSLEEWQKAAGLDWTVERHPMFIEIGKKRIKTDQTALVRSTDKRILTYVSDNWNEVQNSEAFKFFQEFVEKAHMELHTAGSIRNGNMVWVLAKIKKSFTLSFGKKKDEVESYLLFSLPHEYGKCIDIRFTPIRVVCNNTLTLALNDKSDLMVRLNHRRAFDPDMVKKTLKIAGDKLDDYEEMAKFLSTKRFKKDALNEYLTKLYPSASKKEADNDNPKLSLPARRIMDVLDEQPGADLGRGTWWQPFNAVTYAIDHTLGHGADTRLASAWYGSNRKKKIEALELAVEYANAA